MLADIVGMHMDLPSELSEAIRSLNDIFGICSVKNYYHGTPKSEDAERVLWICDEVSKLFNQQYLKWVLGQKSHGAYLKLN
jgi:hypothetical protein